MLRDTEQKIEELANMMERTKGCQIPRCIHQIFDLLYKTFADLRKDLKNGDVLMEQHSYLLDSEVFNGCATRMERIRFTLYPILTFAVPITAVVLGFTISWWFLLATLSFFQYLPATRILYKKVIFRAALQSEPIFCFLFHIGEVGICTADDSIRYYTTPDSTSVYSAK